MAVRFCYDPSQSISENDHVLLMDHVKRCFVLKVERNKYVKICKDKFKIDTLIGLNYGQIFTKVDNEWIKVNRKDEKHRSYWDLLESDYQESAEAGPDSAKDNRNLFHNAKSQKLTADDINKMKKRKSSSDHEPSDVNASELITTIVQNSETFQSRTSMSKEKYIRRKEFRHLKLFEVRHCDLMSVCESYFAGFPHKIGYLRFESLGMMLHTANVQFNQRAIVFDHSLGLITGAIAQRLQGTGRIYRLVTKGVSDKIVHELGVNYYENILSVDYDQVMRYCSGGEDDKPEAEKADSLKVEKEGDTQNEGPLDPVSELDGDDLSLEHPAKRVKREALPGIYPLSKISEEDLVDVDLVIGNVSFNKCGKNNALVNEYTFNIMKMADKFLKPDGRLVVFGQHWQPLTQCYATLTRSNQYINARLDETFVREYQVKRMCTHPVITRCRPCCGFVLSAIKVSHLSPV